MPNIIPPILSSSPPPLDPIDDDDNDDDEVEDDFGDFNVADFSSNHDCTIPKIISDTSWAVPNSNQHLTLPETCENDVVSHGTLIQDDVLRPHNEGLEDEEILQNADNTSHDSVISAVTDSGNCSASQNSSGTSPMPSVDTEDEPTIKLSACHSHQNGSVSELQREVPIYVDGNQNSSELCVIESTADQTFDVNGETSGEVSSCIAVQNTEGSTPAQSHIEKISSELEDIPPFNDQCLDPKNIALETEASFVSTTTVNADNSDPFFQNEPNSSLTKDRLIEEEWNNKQVSAPSTEFDTIKQDHDPDKNERDVKIKDNESMIIPEMPDLNEGDEGIDDDDFGEFSGVASPAHHFSNTASDEPQDDLQFESPSRRPTLVLADEYESSLPVFEEMHDTSDDNFVSTQEGLSSVHPSSEAETSTPSFNISSSVDPVDDEFADFTHAQAGGEASVSDVWAQTAQAAQVSSDQKSMPIEDPPEFDDFDDFESAEFQSAAPKYEPPPNSFNDLETVQSRLSELLKENFPLNNGNYSLAELDNISSSLSGNVLDVEESSVWQGLRDLEAAHSLSFQWPGSHSNRSLLGALNIDSRNILFGPKWNTVVPRFAANLGFSPLEPVRAIPNQPPSEPTPRPEIIQPQVVETIKSSSSEQGEVVPAAQFDWSDSGLTNPLDSVKDSSSGPLATTVTSGNPVITSTPLQVEELLAKSKRSTPVPSMEKKNRDPTLSPEAVHVLDTLPELAFLSARMLMFPVQGDRSENKL